MCGITGFISTSGYVNTNDFHSVLSLLVANEERGVDSAGIAFMGKDIRIRKAPVSAYKLLKRIKYIPELTALIGHTRYATVGSINKRNAHPFRFGRITGLHNGHVTNYLSINSKLSVDSEAIFYLLNKYNNDFIEAFKELSGQFAIAWFDERDKTALYLAKSGNPLYIAKTNTGYFFSSIEQSLRTILLRDIKEWVEIKDDDAIKITASKGIEKFKINFANNYNYSNYKYDEYYDYPNSTLSQQYKQETMEEILMEYGYWSVKSGICQYCKSTNNVFAQENTGEIACAKCLKQFGFMEA